MIKIKTKVDFSQSAHGRRIIKPTARNSKPKPPVPPGRLPRISRLMAVAIKLERMLLTSEVNDISELARLSHVSQPRMSQILALNLLAPDIQELLLFLPRAENGKPEIHEKSLRPITKNSDWNSQRNQWEKLTAARNG